MWRLSFTTKPSTGSSGRRFAFNLASSRTEAGGTTSPASSQATQSPVAREKEWLRAAAKSSTHPKVSTLAPSDLASSTVPSVEPVSTTITSSNRPATDSSVRPSVPSSFRTIIASDHFTVSPQNGESS